MKVWIAIGLGVLLLGAGVVAARAHNELAALDVEVDTQWHQVENQLERRYELLPKLTAVAERYAEHEKSTFEQLAASRAAYAGASADAKPRLAKDVDGAILRVLAIAESYPDLKADQQYSQLAYEIAGTQNRIALERQRYNEVVGLRNARLQQLPWSLVAIGMKPRPFYDPPDAKLQDPELGL